MKPHQRIVALAGGVGAARFLRGLVLALERAARARGEPAEAGAEAVTAIVNTGDDCVFYGVHVSPDLDIVTYTLAGQVDTEKGYGLARDSFGAVEGLAALGHATWFRLGDRDLASCLHRTLRLREGAGLALIADEIRRAYRVPLRILPMSEDPCPTFVELRGGRRVHFEEYLARDGAPDEVERVDLGAARHARPGPAVCESLRQASAILVCPSNPVVSIGPIVAVPGVREAIAASRAPVVAVSPIVGGAPVKGPADRLLRGIGAEVSARGVARLYRDWVHGFVLDTRDAGECRDVEALGLRARAVDTLMRDAEAAARVASAALELACEIRTDLERIEGGKQARGERSQPERSEGGKQARGERSEPT